MTSGLFQPPQPSRLAQLSRFSRLFVFGTFFGLAGCLGDSGGDLWVLAERGTDGAPGADEQAAAGSSQGGCELDDAGQAVLDLVNEARTQARECGDDSFDAADPVTWSCQLERAAQAHSDDMAEEDFFSHTGSDGMQVSDRVDAQDYTWSAVGENIAAGQPSADIVVEGWLSSPGHCSNIMNSRFTEMGVATAEAPDRGVSPYWTQVFARPR